ncbi:MAG: hypothetical protein CXT77_03105 [uncultured DHVE6 group euryarchaeote]|jgi:hypothetical protein|nr:MAG: hypothetical protein CXT77_03105 [uncultured DHVE6 group euryarchaeote]
MIGPKEWEELKVEISKLAPILRVKRLKSALVRASDKEIKNEIGELVLKAESESIEFSFREVKSVPGSLENLVSGRKVDENMGNRNIEEIALEDSSLTSSEIKKDMVNYDPNKKTEFYDSSDESLSSAYKPVSHSHHEREFESNNLNKRKDYVTREESDFSGRQA